MVSLDHITVPGIHPTQAEGNAHPSMISSLLNELNEDDDKVRKEKMISGVAAAAYTGIVLIQASV